MATRMQQRRGTAAQWISTNSGDGPILEVGEIGFETDSGKFKIGDGINNWVDLPYFADVDTLGTALDGDFVEITDIGAVSGVAGLDANKNLLVPGASIIVEGSTDNTFETTLTVTDPTADRTITFPDASGTVALTTDIAAGTVTETGTQTLTNKTLTSPTINGATIGGSLIPSANATYDLGSSTNKFKDLYLSGSTLYLDAATIALHSGNVQLSHSGNTTTIPISGGAHTVATESYVNTAVSNLVDTAPSTLNTLNELAAAINDDASFASTITTALGNKLDSSTAASTYAPIASPTFTGTVEGITKSMVGLANVDNTTDLLKPISTATQTALDLKAPLASPTFTGTVSGITATMVGLGNVDNTSDVNKPVSTATQTALDLKLDSASPAVDYYITNSGSGAYLVNGVSNGNIYFEKGKKYRIHVNASGHPFWIQTVSGAYSSEDVYSTGITNNGAQSGHIIVELPSNAPQLYYACQYHSSMAGSVITGTTFATYKALADLSNVNNTSDANKPISTATQTALDLKANLADAVPSQATHSGKYLTTNGTSASWEVITFPYVPIPVTSVSSNTSLSSNNRYFVNTSASRTLTLPASPIDGDEIQIFDIIGLAATNSIIVDSNGAKVNGTVQNLEIDINNDVVVLVYTGSSYGWSVI